VFDIGHFLFNNGQLWPGVFSSKLLVYHPGLKEPSSHNKRQLCEKNHIFGTYQKNGTIVDMKAVLK